MTTEEIQTNRPYCPNRQAGNRYRRSDFNGGFLWIGLCLLVIPLQAQDLLPFQGETLHYSIRYKYGLVTLKAGAARYSVDTVIYKQKPALKSSLHFKTNSFFDKILMIRDTLTAYASIPNLTPLYHNRSVNEGNCCYTEEIWIRQHDSCYTEINVKRMQKGLASMDTLIRVDNLGYDFLNIFLFVRSIDYSLWKPNETRRITTFMGDRKANIILRYAGQKIFEKTNRQKQNAFYLTIDIANEVFAESKSAMEIWLSEDTNRIPLKLKAKLKIGAAEAELL